MTKNKLEQELEEEIRKFFEVREKYLISKTRFGPGFEVLIELQQAEDAVRKAILIFLTEPTNNSVPYLWIMNYIRNRHISRNERYISDNIIIILGKLIYAHSKFNLNDEIVEHIYLEILYELLEYSSVSAIIRYGSLDLIKLIKFFEDNGKTINGLSPREWTKEFYTFNIKYLICNSDTSRKIMQFHNVMTSFDEVYPGINEEFLLIQALYKLKS